VVGRRKPKKDDGRSVLPGRFKKLLQKTSAPREVADADDSVRIAPRRQPDPRTGRLGSLMDDDLDE
jgi:hypothetical protein